MVNDPVGDMIAQIKNASFAGLKIVTLPYSRLKHSVATIMVKEGYLVSADKSGERPNESLTLGIRYVGKKPVVTDLKRKSKPGLRIYVGRKEIPAVVGGMGIAIISTSKGIMTGKDAKKMGLGGELLCEIW